MYDPDTTFRALPNKCSAGKSIASPFDINRMYCFGCGYDIPRSQYEAHVEEARRKEESEAA